MFVKFEEVLYFYLLLFGSFMKLMIVYLSVSRGFEMFELLEEICDGVVVLMMNCFEWCNVLLSEMMGGLCEVIFCLVSDFEVCVFVLMGVGGVFCVGGDVKGMNEGYQLGVLQLLQECVQGFCIGMEFLKQIYEFLKLMIVMILGLVVGVGFLIVFVCDFCYVVEYVKIMIVFVKVGFLGDYGGSYFLFKFVGDVKVCEFYFFGDVLFVFEVECLGIINCLMLVEEFEGFVMVIVQCLVEGLMIVYGYMKKNFNVIVNGGLIDEVFDFEVMYMLFIGQIEDYKNVVCVFVEKCKLIFEGKQFDVDLVFMKIWGVVMLCMFCFIWVVCELGFDFEYLLFGLCIGEMQIDEFIVFNVSQKIFVFEDGDFVFCESGVIVSYFGSCYGDLVLIEVEK